MHERSETIQNKNGKWVNVYGKGLLKQGKVLPILYPWFEQEEYDTEKQAVAAAKQRSDLYKEDEPEKPVGTRTKPVDDDAPKKMRNTEEKGMFSSGNKIIDVFEKSQFLGSGPIFPYRFIKGKPSSPTLRRPPDRKK